MEGMAGVGDDRLMPLFQDCMESFPGDEGRCSYGLLLLHPQISVQLWGSYGEA